MRGRRLAAVPVLLALLGSLLLPATSLAATTPNATAITAGTGFACAMRANRTVGCWGLNDHGELGDGTTTNRLTPVAVVGITTATAITAGAYHACALLANRTVRCWGRNDLGQVGDGTQLNNRLTPVAVAGISTAIAISAGSYFTCAVLANGTARCWGESSDGQLGDGTNTSSPIPVAVSGITTAVAIGAGERHACAVLANHTARCWGDNLAGQVGDGTDHNDRLIPVAVSGITTATSITGGDYRTCVLLANGTVKCWGSVYLGDGTNTSSLIPVAVSGITTATAIEAGYAYTCAVLANGTARCWGLNNFGALGDGSGMDQKTPVAVTGISTATAIAAGYFHTCAVLADGSVRCWGANTYGALGDGTTTDRPTPVTAKWDLTPPTATAPATALRTGASLAGTAGAFPVRVTWTGADTGGSGIARYELARSTDGGTTWGTPASVTALSYSTTVPSSGTVRFRVHAIDRAGNTGAWALGLVLSPSLVQQTSTAVKYTGSWYGATSTSYSGGSAKYAKTAGASASYTFTGRSVAFVTTRATSRGKVNVYLDGALVITLDTYAATTAYRALAWGRNFAASGTHTVKLVVVGTAGRPRVDLDAFAVVK